MVELLLGEINVKLSKENDKVRIISPGLTPILNADDLLKVSEILKINFDIVYNFYLSKLIDPFLGHKYIHHINIVSLNIVFHWMHIYDGRNAGFKEDYYSNLLFRKEYFLDIYTYDLIIYYFKKIALDRWEELCALLISMTIEEFKIYYANREKFYTMF